MSILTGEDVRCLSVRPPWSWAIIYRGKDVENRSRATSYRGPLYIHSSLRLDYDAPGECWPPAEEQRVSGAIIGRVTLVEVLSARGRRPGNWAQPDAGFWWILANPVPLPEPVPCRGQLGLWRPDEEVAARVRAA